MQVLESTRRMMLPDPRSWVCEGWHGNAGWLQTALPAMHRLDRRITTLLHAGDRWMDLDAADYWSARSGIDRVLMTLGNHERWGEYTPLLDSHPGAAVRVSDVVWLLPRPWRFEIFGREILRVGAGAKRERTGGRRNVFSTNT